MRSLLIAVLVSCSGPAFADMLWAIDGDNSVVGNLWTIDTTTGAATKGPALSKQIVGDISWLNGTLYTASNSGGPGQGFGTVHPGTGLVTVINSSINGVSLAAIPNLSLFYDVGAGAADVNIITPTGSFNHLSGNGTDDFVDDLAYDALHGILYASSNLGVLATIDLNTGEGTTIGPMFGGRRRHGPIAYDWNTNTLYMLDSDNLYSLNTTNGAATLIGSTGVSGVFFTGFADLPTPTPEPASAGLIGIGLAGFWLAARRSRAT